MLCRTLFLPTRKRLVWYVKPKYSLGCSYYLPAEFKILRAAWRAHSKLTTLELRKADIDLFRDLLGRLPWDNFFS